MSNVSLIESHKCAFKGLYQGFHKQRNIKIQLFLLILVISVSIILKTSLIETLIITISAFLVIFLELINTAIEKLCNRIEPKLDSEIKIVKDIAAGAVLLSALLTATVSAIILLKPILDLFI